MRNTKIIALMAFSTAIFQLAASAHAQTPVDNPAAAFYDGPMGYPAWTDRIHWAQVLDMSKYPAGKTNFDKFELARDELAAKGGGILYYPAGTYDFSTMPADGPRGRGLMLRRGVVIRGETPAGKADATTGALDLKTKFVFGFKKMGVDAARGFGGDVPRDWNIVGLMTEPGGAGAEGGQLKDVNDVGICWVHLIGAAIYFGPQLKWGATWGTADGWKSKYVKAAWKDRVPDGTSPLDTLLGAPFGKANFVGMGQGRIVLGCVLEDAAVLNDAFEEGNGPASFYAFKFGSRINVCGSRVLIANNVLPISKRNFKYAQTTRKTSAGKGGSMTLGDFEPDTTILFDYGKTCGLDVNKLLCGPWETGGDAEGVIVRDNWVFNHGHRGFNLAGTWMTIANNHNERYFLKGGADVYGLGAGWTLTLDGNLQSNAGGNGTISDNLSRPFDIAGSHLWIDHNWYNNTGSDPGNDGEGILCQAHGGTHVNGWAITNNTHVKGNGMSSYIGSWDVNQHGCLIAWNETAGWVGVINVTKRDEVDCAFVANKASKVNSKSPDTLVECPKAPPAAPKDVAAKKYATDAVRISWTDASDNEIGFRVDRSIDGAKTWTTIACRPPRIKGTDPEGLAWVDFSAPPGKSLQYRVAALDCDEAKSNISEPTAPLTLDKSKP